MRERDIIARYFNFAKNDSVSIGIGDDAAVVSATDSQLCISSDTLNEGTHFFADAAPYFLARKAAAVSLSDMAAMGARPLWLTVALTAPHGALWLSRFGEGLASSAKEYGYVIVGGDLCGGQKISITTTAIGAIDKSPLLRSGAAVGDEVWISAAVGEAALAVHYRKNKIVLDSPRLFSRLDNPSPRLILGQQLARTASAAMDISDGLLSTAAVVGARSGVDLVLEWEKIPLPQEFVGLSTALQRRLILGGGDDYELLFCAPLAARAQIVGYGAHLIGRVVAGLGGARAVDKNGAEIVAKGYEHDFGD